MTCIRILKFEINTCVPKTKGRNCSMVHLRPNIDKKGFEINCSDISEEIGYKKIGSAVDWNSDNNQNKT